MEIFSFAILAFLMGIKHAFDTDHVLVVSNFLSRSKRLNESLNISLSWGIGLMLTAGIITLSNRIFCPSSSDRPERLNKVEPRK